MLDGKNSKLIKPDNREYMKTASERTRPAQRCYLLFDKFENRTGWLPRPRVIKTIFSDTVQAEPPPVNTLPGAGAQIYAPGGGNDTVYTVIGMEMKGDIIMVSITCAGLKISLKYHALWETGEPGIYRLRI